MPFKNGDAGSVQVRLNAPFIDLHYRPEAGVLPLAGPVPVSIPGSIVLASEVPLLLLVPASQAPTQIKCAKNIVRYPYVITRWKTVPLRGAQNSGHYPCVAQLAWFRQF